MPLSLNLPTSVCYPLTMVARRFSPRSSAVTQDQSLYFEHQYRDTLRRYSRDMQGIDFKGKRVLDVGSGLGGRALAWLDFGATEVINLDINRQELEAGSEILTRTAPDRAGQIRYCHPDDLSEAVADLAILFDSFEHLTDPGPVLKQIHEWLPVGGQVWIGSIGWYHHRASHCTETHIPIPWCQCFFSERAIIKTIRKLLRNPSYTPNVWEQLEGLDRWDKVPTLRDRPGEPMNMLSLRQIRRILKDSPFNVRQFNVHGFSSQGGKLALLAAPLAKIPILQEVFHSYYTAVLEKP